MSDNATISAWSDHALQLARTHARTRLDPAAWRETLKRILVELHDCAMSAPSDVRQAFEDLLEGDLMREAKERSRRIDADHVLDWPDPAGESPRHLFKALSVQLRGIDESLFLDPDAPPTDPEPFETYCRTSDPAGAWRPRFVVKRLNARPALSSRDNHAFVLRGLRHHRLLPARHQDRDVVLYPMSGLTPPETRLPPIAERPLGAALFEGFVCVDPNIDTLAGPFTFKRVSHRDVGETVRLQLRRARHERCFAVVWPELTVPPDVRAAIRRELEDGDDMEGALQVIVAGSWHEADGSKTVNQSQVYSGLGEKLLTFQKILPYRGKGERAVESIESGTRLPVLVTDEALIAFGICRDFCENEDISYPDLDVDLILVPSLGTATAMRGHVQTAQRLATRHRTRSFVVQQEIPARTERLGWVLNCGSNLETDVEQAEVFRAHGRDPPKAVD
ncbi:MAG: hypothetical protein ACFE0R_04285 [Salinarimonas sp.]